MDLDFWDCFGRGKFLVQLNHTRLVYIFEVPYLPYIFGRIKIIIFFTVRTFNLEKNYNFLVSEYLRTPKNYQSSRVFTGIYAVTFPYIPIGVKINNLV